MHWKLGKLGKLGAVSAPPGVAAHVRIRLDRSLAQTWARYRIAIIDGRAAGATLTPGAKTVVAWDERRNLT